MADEEETVPPEDAAETVLITPRGGGAGAPEPAEATAAEEPGGAEPAPDAAPEPAEGLPGGEAQRAAYLHNLPAPAPGGEVY
jgi:hypothetical protein